LRTPIVYGLLALVLGIAGQALPAAALAAEEGPGMGGRGGMMAEMLGEQGKWFRDLAGSPLRFLADPETRQEIGLTPEQDAKVAALREKAQAIVTKMQEDMRASFTPPDPNTPMTPEDQQALMMERMKVAADALKAVQPQLEAIVNEANAILTPEQQAKLKEVGQDRARLMMAGSLWVLTTKKAKDELQLTDDQVRQIRKMVTEVAEKVDSLRKDMMAAIQEVPQEERGAAMRARREAYTKDVQDITTRVRGNIFALLTAEQKPKAEKMLAEARGPGFGPGGLRSLERRPTPPGGAAPGVPNPAAPAPAAPAPAAPPPPAPAPAAPAPAAR